MVIRAAMDPHRYRKVLPLGVSRCPDIQIKAVFAHFRRPHPVELPPIESSLLEFFLGAYRPESITYLNAVPRDDGLGSLPAQVSDRRCCKRDSAVYGDTVFHDAFDLSAFYAYDRILLRAGKGGDYFIRCLQKDTIMTTEDAQKEIYRRMRPQDPPTAATA